MINTIKKKFTLQIINIRIGATSIMLNVTNNKKELIKNVYSKSARVDVSKFLMLIMISPTVPQPTPCPCRFFQKLLLPKFRRLFS